MSILEEFWYGNIEPTEYVNSNACKEALKLVCLNEEKLLATLTDAQKDLFTRYADSAQSHQSMSECLLFQSSFTLGAKIMLEVMSE